MSQVTCNCHCFQGCMLYVLSHNVCELLLYLSVQRLGVEKAVGHYKSMGSTHSKVLANYHTPIAYNVCLLCRGFSMSQGVSTIIAQKWCAAEEATRLLASIVLSIHNPGRLAVADGAAVVA